MATIFKSQNIIYSKDTFKVDANIDAFKEMAAAKEEEERAKAERERERDPLWAAKVMSDEILRSAREEAAQILDAAHAEVVRADADAKARAEDLYEQSKREGYDFGYDDGVEAVRVLRVEAEETLEDAKASRQAMLSAMEGEIVNLIIEIARKLVDTAADIDRRVILNLIRRGLSETAATDDIKIHVSKFDYDDAKGMEEEIFELLPGGVSAEIVRNMSFHKGDCVIETNYGNIDCSLERQFEELKKNLLYIYSGTRVEDEGSEASA